MHFPGCSIDRELDLLLNALLLGSGRLGGLGGQQVPTDSLEGNLSRQERTFLRNSRQVAIATKPS